jgi:magnesium-transporting ATPase (P-type)
MPSPRNVQSLYEQFRRVANFYFLAMAGLSLTPFSPVSYITTWAPLILVVGISMVKEALEDRKRHLQDMEQNNSLVDAFSATGERGTVAWREARVGDVLCVLRDEPFPSDLLFLASSNPEGSCYVETKNLDGETNLKLKKCVEPTQGLTDASVADWRATIECDAPNNSLYTFQGNLVYTVRPPIAQQRPASHTDAAVNPHHRTPPPQRKPRCRWGPTTCCCAAATCATRSGCWAAWCTRGTTRR